MYKQDNINQTQHSELRSSLKINPIINNPVIMRTSYPNNIIAYNQNGLGMAGYQSNPMNLVSPKSATQILQIPNSSHVNGINRSFEPYNDVQSPLLDKNLISKKSPYKIQQQRNTADFRNMPPTQGNQNGNNIANLRSNSITHEQMNSNFYQSQPNFNTNNQTLMPNSNFKLGHPNSLEININKDSKNERPVFTRVQILTKIHQKCLQINQMVL